MKIPRKIEWRAGAILLCSSAVLLGLLIVLALVRLDVGLEVKGIINQSETGLILKTNIPEERLALLRRCKYVRLSSHSALGQINRIDGYLLHDRPIVQANIEIRTNDLSITQFDSLEVRAMLLEKKQAPLLEILFKSILNRQKI